MLLHFASICECFLAYICTHCVTTKQVTAASCVLRIQRRVLRYWYLILYYRCIRTYFSVTSCLVLLVYLLICIFDLKSYSPDLNDISYCAVHIKCVLLHTFFSRWSYIIPVLNETQMLCFLDFSKRTDNFCLENSRFL